MMVDGEPMPSMVTARPRPSRHSATPMLREGFPTTIIVGAGIAGLACARRLHNAQRPFLVISENVAGRVQRSGDGVVNLGAYYVRGDYTHVNRYVQLGRRISTVPTSTFFLIATQPWPSFDKPTVQFCSAPESATPTSTGTYARGESSSTNTGTRPSISSEISSRNANRHPTYT